MLKRKLQRYIKVVFSFLLIFIMLSQITSIADAEGTAVHTINSNQATLTIRQLQTNQYGIGVQLNNTTTYYEQNQPMAVEVVNSSGNATWLTGAYSAVQDMGNGSFKCTGSIQSANNSVFHFTDIYKAEDNSGAFEMSRTVKVTTANSNDKGFSTRFAIQRPVTSSMNDYDFFVPGVWYKNNQDVNNVSLATDYSDYYYWFREDRMPIPMIMLRQKNNGATLSITHKNPDASTFKEEDGLNRIIDSRLKFASLGMENNNQPLVGMLFPGTEGERTYIYGTSTAKRWALRSNPVTANFTQNYTAVIRLTATSDFVSAMKQDWQSNYNMINPAIYNCDLNKIYLDGVNILNRYWAVKNGVPSFPFSVNLNGVANSYDGQMGFISQWIPNAWILIREGYNANNPTMRSRGEQIVNWWADNSLTGTGCPRTWWDTNSNSWRSYDTYIRVACDGFGGMLSAWNEGMENGTNHQSWLNACAKFGDWLITKQAADGSIGRAYNYNTNQVTDSGKTSTSHMVKYLVDLYMITDLEKYKDAAIKAGNYIYTTEYQNFRYVGGTPDNPNVPDKEAVSMSLNAFMALYDLTKASKWLDAASQTAYYYETWVYVWDVPRPTDDPLVTYPKNRTTTGLSLIATGNAGADSYAAYDAFNFYRLYLYKNDPHLLKAAKLLLYNTKQTLDWDTSDPLGYGDPGLQQEAGDICVPRGRSVGVWLPWQTYGLMDPMIKLWDYFGSTYSINEIEQKTLSQRQSYNNNYSNTRGFYKGTVSNQFVDSIQLNCVYTIVNKNSGKVLDVAGSSTDNSANIQQYSSNGSTGQQWKVLDAGAGYVKLMALCSSKLADVEASSTADGANISQYPDMNTYNQHWMIYGVGGGYWKIVNRNSSKVMDVVNFSKDNGANVTQYQDNATTNQQWGFILVGNGH